MRTVQTDSVCIISLFSDKYYFLQENLNFGREGINYYSFRLIIRINKNKKKRKTSNTSSREFYKKSTQTSKPSKPSIRLVT